VINIGFIGLGRMAANHLQRLQQIPEARVVAGAELDPDRREETALKFGLRGYADYKEMLDREELDAVYVCVPPFAHEGQEEAVVERGLALFVEKPVCLDLDYARRTADLISSKGVINSVGYMCRYLDVVEEARHLVGESPIVAMRGFYFGPLPPTEWWRRAELSGGQIVEQATHVVDLMRYLAGEVEAVSGLGYRGAMPEVNGYNIHDATSVNLRFCNGAIANLTTACVLHNQYCPGLEIITPGCRLWLDLPPQPAKLIQLDGVNRQVLSEQDRFIGENQAFVKAAIHRDQSLIRSDYLDAMHTLELTLAAQAAVDGNTEIRLCQR
jgi:predicted dehydrogenase